MKPWFLAALVGLASCTKGEPPDLRRGTGDADRGRDVLLYGDYVGGGIPADLWFSLLGSNPENLLNREGRAAGLSPGFNLFTAPSGAEVVGGITCLGCHGSMLDGEFFIGKGETQFDYSGNQTALFEVARLAVENRYGRDSAEFEAFDAYGRGGEAIGAFIRTPFAGPNPAFSIERAAVAFRDPQTLEWQDEPVFSIPEVTMAGDVPAWWNVKKKTRLYSTAMAGGDVATLIAQVSMVGLIDVDQFDRFSDDMVDVLAFIDQLEPPQYPGVIDAPLAEQGRTVFESTCSTCHGTYGADWTYPQRVIPFDEVGTDPLYGQAFNGDFGEWLRASHMFEEGRGAFFESTGYVAPPLDGIWSTGPYLHNGSVPDLRSLLNSPTRPAQWERLAGVDLDRLGHAWREPQGTSNWIYDTTQTSYGNQGHTYGDALSAEDRDAVLEYLKTL